MQEGLGLPALVAHRLRSAIVGDQVQYAGAVQFRYPVQLRPVTTEQRFQAIEVAAMLALVQIQLGDQRPLLPAMFARLAPRLGCAFQVQPPDQVGGLGVV